MDVLTDRLQTVRLHSHPYGWMELTAPWGMPVSLVFGCFTFEDEGRNPLVESLPQMIHIRAESGSSRRRRGIKMPTLKINHERCTECRMCYVACREINLDAVYVALEPLHRLEIDPQRCFYPKCTVCLAYCPAEGSIIEAESGRWMVPPPPDMHRWWLKGKS